MRWPTRKRFTTRAPATLSVCLLVLVILAAADSTGAAVIRYPVVDAVGDGLATVTFDDEKAVRLGEERGFLFTVNPTNASLNLSVRLDVDPVNGSALKVTEVPPRASLRDGAVTLFARLATLEDAEPRRYPVNVSVVVLNPQAVNASTMVTRAAFPMNVTVSRLPTPLGETGSTVSMEEWVTLGSLALAVAGATGIYRVARRRGRRPRRHGRRGRDA